ncbi:hypothetical protein NXF25_012630 [Crotalus adamanteus]|uniref:Uncharacterized protein n=1 Tax=Crotalus adamanteus TaxID=8729 RepID=A0AAW1BD24_CROAD
MFWRPRAEPADGDQSQKTQARDQISDRVHS